MKLESTVSKVYLRGCKLRIDKVERFTNNTKQNKKCHLINRANRNTLETFNFNKGTRYIHIFPIDWFYLCLICNSKQERKVIIWLKMLRNAPNTSKHIRLVCSSCVLFPFQLWSTKLHLLQVNYHKTERTLKSVH